MCGKLKRVSLFSSQVKAGLQIVENGRSSKYWNQIRRTGQGADQRGASPSRCCSFLPLLRSNPSAALNCSGLRSRSPCVLPAAQVWIWKSIFSVRLVFALSVQFSLDQNVFFLSYMIFTSSSGSSASSTFVRFPVVPFVRASELLGSLSRKDTPQGKLLRGRVRSIIWKYVDSFFLQF